MSCILFVTWHRITTAAAEAKVRISVNRNVSCHYTSFALAFNNYLIIDSRESDSSPLFNSFQTN